MNGLPFVSVIVPVYNDKVRLLRCIEALESQNWPDEKFEVLVVDNNSHDDPIPITKRFPHVRWGRELYPGAYAARNRGIRAARGEIIAFTDSDCMPDPKWIAEGVKALTEDRNAGLAGGQICLFFADPKRLTPAELFERKKAFRHEEQIRKYFFAVTANLFTWKSVIDRVGFFDQCLKSGGDVEWGNRVHRAGYSLVYAPAAKVFHPARRKLADLHSKTVRVVGGIRDKRRGKPRPIGVAIAEFLHSCRVIIGLTNRFFKGMPPSNEFKSPRERTLYLLAVAYVETVRNYEWLRLSLGGESRR